MSVGEFALLVDAGASCMDP